EPARVLTLPLSAVTRQINLPFYRAVEISLRSLKIRFARSLVTSAVVALATGFLVYMLSVERVTARLEVGEVLVKSAHAQRVWVALISMLVAAVGITNTLYMSVAERYREIGTMKCLGALNRFVVELFLLESLALGAIGSAAGALIGTVLATVPWVFRAKDLAAVGLPWSALGRYFLAGLGVGMVLTIVGALYPAFRAARMVPADAMRTEV
ncbi:MAG: FtsX-like permease family protein, partial [bacterium]